MSKPSELRDKTSEQLTFDLAETQRELFRLRIQAATERLDAPSNLRKLRREIARVHTILREREIVTAATAPAVVPAAAPATK